jgi:hypothetical protein
MPVVERAEYLLAIIVQAPGVEFLYAHNCKEILLLVAKGDLGRVADLAGIDGKADRYWKNGPVSKPEGVHNRVIIRFAHEAVKRRKRACREQFEVKDTAWRKRYGTQRVSMLTKPILFLRRISEVNQGPSIWRDQIGVTGVRR